MQDNLITYYQVDSFTSISCLGNPAGVFVLYKQLNDVAMQIIARDLNFSETAFIVPVTSGNINETVNFDLRWFTPSCEVDLCGHATLASAKVLYDIYQVSAETIIFHTKSGSLEAKRHEDYIQLDLPAGDPQPVELPEYYKNAVGLNNPELSSSFFGALQCQRSKSVLVRLRDVENVKQVSPNFEALCQAEDDYGSAGLIVTAMGDVPYDFTSRFFAPSLGIDEDPVTGAAHTVLGPYWSIMLNKKKMFAHQASQRGGEMIVEIKKDPKGYRDRALLSGQAAIVDERQMKLAVESE